jgi:hypothetical protein
VTKETNKIFLKALGGFKVENSAMRINYERMVL